MRAIATLCLVATLGAQAGCWDAASSRGPARIAGADRQDAFAQPVVPAREQPARRHRGRRALPRRSVWTGSYSCAPGDSAVMLTIDLDPRTSAAVAVVEVFEASAGVLLGASRLRGTYEALADGPITIDVDPDEWILQPPGQAMVGFKASTDAALRTLTGSMKGACGPLRAVRDSVRRDGSSGDAPPPDHRVYTIAPELQRHPH